MLGAGYARIDLYKQPAIEPNFIEEALQQRTNIGKLDIL